ncbi:hypothetical protein ATCM_02940 [Stenotrophomonas sp. ATCM1_4]|nr:hypothetical protein ATCM_02940 [Stenotrophomonas sp. ATCM1_4]
MRDGIDSVMPSFTAVLLVSAAFVIPVVSGIWAGQWAARVSGRMWVGWAAGLTTAIVVFVVCMQLQQALPRQWRYWIHRFT